MDTTCLKRCTGALHNLPHHYYAGFTHFWQLGSKFQKLCKDSKFQELRFKVSVTFCGANSATRCKIIGKGQTIAYGRKVKIGRGMPLGCHSDLICQMDRSYSCRRILLWCIPKELTSKVREDGSGSRPGS